MHIDEYKDNPFFEMGRRAGKTELAGLYMKTEFQRFIKKDEIKHPYFYAMIRELANIGYCRKISIKNKRRKKFQKYLERQMGIKNIMYTEKKPYKHYIFDDSISKMYPEVIKPYQLSIKDKAVIKW